MEPPEYDGTIHPDKWVKKVRLFCQLKQITTDQEILNICKLSINPNIRISSEENINTIDKLIKVLIENPFYIVLKNTAKRKLQYIKYVSEKDGGDTIKFIRDFCSLCYDANIYGDINEVKKYLYQSLNDKSLQKEFSNKLEYVESIGELVTKFEKINSEHESIIKYGSRVALRHVATGKYLTSIDKNYETSQDQIAFAGKYFPTSDSTWIIVPVDNRRKGCISIKEEGDVLEYEDYGIGLVNEETNKAIRDTGEMAQRYGHYYVCCDGLNVRNSSFHWKIQFARSQGINSCVKSQDIINIIYLSHFSRNLVLRSHELAFKVDFDMFQEVVIHNEGIGKNEEWCIELIE